MKVTVFGAGYVGLVSAACFSEIGHSVVCVDNNPEKIKLLKQGLSPLYEIGLQGLLDKHCNKQLLFSQDPTNACQNADVILIAVGTPLKDDSDINLDYVFEVAETIANHLTQPTTLVLKSTTPPGTAEKLTRFINKKLLTRERPFKIDVASNPEFLQEGNAIQQFMYPDRIIIGAENITTIQTLHDLYQPTLKNKDQFVIMDKASAELTKYASNALLATKVSFINEISQIAETVGANINSIKHGIGLDYRINPNFLNAGCGFGGSCFPKDIQTLITTAKKNQVNPLMLESVMQRNLSQQQLLFHKVDSYFNHKLKGKTIALWGLTFKPNTDDVRCATSLKLAKLFLEAGATLQVYDPLGIENFSAYFTNQPNIEYGSSALQALEKADVLVIATEWREFKEIPLSEIKKQLKCNAVFDGRNLLNRELAAQQGLNYFGIGLGDTPSPNKENLPPSEKGGCSRKKILERGEI